MGIFSRLKFWKKKEEPLPAVPEIKPEITPESTRIENVKAKMDLILTQLDSLRVQNETLSERIKNIERLVTEIRGYCK